MMVAPVMLPLIDRLPPVRGRYSVEADLAHLTWFKVGGPAEVLYRPADADDLADFLAGRPKDVPLTFIGAGSNLLVRDGGVPGVVIRLGRGFTDMRIEGQDVIAGGGALDMNIALAAQSENLSGLEFLSGIPGTLGGALRMNAGAYGREIKDVLVSCRALDGSGNWHEAHPEDLAFGYRHCGAPEDWLFVEARLRGNPGDAAAIAARMAEIKQTRTDSQPTGSRTGGSTFANPPEGRAWEWIDRAGCRGLRRGGAMVSEQHCNFLINTGSASAADLEGLGEEVRRRVYETSGVSLHWEIRRIGVPERSPLHEVTS
ncbi:UDP-N-acetylmuramate dehydrogenase [Magnetospira thiophila]